MDIEDYDPISTLKVEENIVKKSKYPFIDVHNHQFDMPLKDLSKLGVLALIAGTLACLFTAVIVGMII